jgi:hypothetical protein
MAMIWLSKYFDFFMWISLV